MNANTTAAATFETGQFLAERADLLAEQADRAQLHLVQRIEAFAPEPGDHLAGFARRLVAIALQQQAPVCIHQLEMEAAVGFAVLLDLRKPGGGRLLRTGTGCSRLERAQADGALQAVEQSLQGYLQDQTTGASAWATTSSACEADRPLAAARLAMRSSAAGAADR